MEPFSAGWLSLIPPFAAIVMALISREVVSSLLFGILTGSFIYAAGTGGDWVLGTLDSAFGIMEKTVQFKILIFTSLLGALVYLVSLSGGARAYGEWAAKRIRTRRSTLFSAGTLGFMVFIDDYFNCLFVGTVMRPVSDQQKISRAKLAWIIDSTAAPVCILAPVSSWAAAVGASMQGVEFGGDSTMSVFMATIPWNFYALLALGFMLFMLWRGRDFGPMARLEAEALRGLTVKPSDEESDEAKLGGRGDLKDMLIPIFALIALGVAALLYSGGYWGDDSQFHSIGAAIGNSSSDAALVQAAFGALIVSFILYVPRRILTFSAFMDGAVKGMKLMLPANVILILAWTLSGVCRDLLMATQYVEGVVDALGADFGTLLPGLAFLIACGLAFATGASWATFGILVPIIVPAVQAVSPELAIPALAAILAGSVFGDHASPISDTTILSAASSRCLHMDHVASQLPYAILPAIAATAGYLVAGVTGGNYIASATVALAVMVLLIVIAFMRSGGAESQSVKIDTPVVAG